MPQLVRNFQTPYTAADLLDYWRRDSFALVSCWLLTPRADSVIADPVGATNHTRDLELPGHPGIRFKSTLGLLPSAVDTESGSEGAGLEIEAVFDDDAITEAALSYGDWDGAMLEVFSVNPNALRMGELLDFSGSIGSVVTADGQFKAEARQLTTVARLKLGRLVSARCDVREYGDNRCKKDLSVLTRTGTVTVSGGDPVPTQTTFRASALDAPTFDYKDGLVIWLTGRNAGRKGVIKNFTSATKQVELQRPLPYAPLAGETFTIIEGCPRTLAACAARDNAANYRGFPFITNIEEINKIIRAN